MLVHNLQSRGSVWASLLKHRRAAGREARGRGRPGRGSGSGSGKRRSEMLRTAVLGTAVAAAAAAAYVVLSPGRKAAPLLGGGEEELAPALTEAETLQIMSSILDKVKMIAMRMVQASENIKAQLAQQGQEMDDRKLMKTFIYQHFVDQLEQIQSSVLSEFDAEESELEDAVTVYLSGGGGGEGSSEEQIKAVRELREIVSKIKELNYQFGGDRDSDESGSGAGGIGADGDGEGDGDNAGDEGQREVTLGDLLDVIETLTVRISDEMDDYITNFKDLHGDPDATNIEQFHHGFMKLTEEIEKRTLAELEITPIAFQKALERNSHQQQIQLAFMKMQMASQQKMAEHGLQM